MYYIEFDEIMLDEKRAVKEGKVGGAQDESK